MKRIWNGVALEVAQDGGAEDGGDDDGPEKGDADVVKGVGVGPLSSTLPLEFPTGPKFSLAMPRKLKANQRAK